MQAPSLDMCQGGLSWTVCVTAPWLSCPPPVLFRTYIPPLHLHKRPLNLPCPQSYTPPRPIQLPLFFEPCQAPRSPLQSRFAGPGPIQGAAAKEVRALPKTPCLGPRAVVFARAQTPAPFLGIAQSSGCPTEPPGLHCLRLCDAAPSARHAWSSTLWGLPGTVSWATAALLAQHCCGGR